MWAFCLVIFLIIIGFSLIFLEFDRDTEYKDQLYATYNLLYGGSDYDGFSPSQLIFLAVILFFLNVVLLNMLITIMGNSISDVTDQKVLSNSLTMLDLIIDSAVLRLLDRNDNKNKGYILYCEPKEVEDVKASNEGQMAQKIETLHTQIDRLNSNMKLMEETMSTNYMSLMAAIKKLESNK